MSGSAKAPCSYSAAPTSPPSSKQSVSSSQLQQLHGAAAGSSDLPDLCSTVTAQPKRPPVRCERISRRCGCRVKPAVCAIHTGPPKVVMHRGDDRSLDVLDDLLVFLYISHVPLWLRDPLGVGTEKTPLVKAFQLCKLAYRAGCVELQQSPKGWLLRLFRAYRTGQNSFPDHQLFKHFYGMWDEQHERVEEKDLWHSWYLALARNAEANLTGEFFRDALEKQPVFRRGFMHAMASIITSHSIREQEQEQEQDRMSV